MSSRPSHPHPPPTPTVSKILEPPLYVIAWFWVQFGKNTCKKNIVSAFHCISFSCTVLRYIFSALYYIKMALFSTNQNAVILSCILLTMYTVFCIDAFPFLYFQMFHSRLQNNLTSQLTNKNTLWMIGKVSWMFFYSRRPRNGVQCYSGPEFGFSNVPQKCVKTMENLNVHYAWVLGTQSPWNVCEETK